MSNQPGSNYLADLEKAAETVRRTGEQIKAQGLVGEEIGVKYDPIREARNLAPLSAHAHPAVMAILDQVLPGKKTRDFSLNFSMKNFSTITAEIILSEEDGEVIEKIIEEWDIQIKPEPTEPTPKEIPSPPIYGPY